VLYIITGLTIVSYWPKDVAIIVNIVVFDWPLQVLFIFGIASAFYIHEYLARLMHLERLGEHSFLTAQETLL